MTKTFLMTRTSFVAGLTLGLAGTFLVILPATPSFAQVNGGNGAVDPISGGGGGGGGSFGGGTGGLGAVNAGDGGNGVGGNATGNGGGGAGVGGGGGGFFAADTNNNGAPGSGTIGSLTNTGIIQGGAGALDNFGDGGGGGGAGIGGGGADPGAGAGGAAGFTLTNSTITNSGTISGGAGGTGGSGGGGGGAGIGNGGAAAGAAGGAGLNNLIIINSGTIRGGNGGAAAGGVGGAGITGSGMTITNQGTIGGGLNGDGLTRANAITLTGGSNTLTLQTGSILTGNIAIDAGTLTFNQSTAQTLSNIVTGAGGVINNSTGTLTLSGANTYAGGTTVQSGTLQLSGAGTLGAATGLLAISSGTLNLGGTSQTTGALTLAGGAIANGTLSSSSFGVQAGTISAMLAGGGALTKTGPGSVTLSGANTYAGGTTVQGGTLQLSGAGTLGAATGSLAISSGTLDLGGTSQTTGALTLTSGTIQNGTLSSSSFGVQAGAISTVLAGGGALTKTGAGSVTLSGANTYAGGTTVQGGTLQLSGAGTLGAATGSLAISSATLDLGATSQTTGALTLTSGTIENGTLSSSSFGVQAGTISAILAGGGALTKTGPGSVTLSGANTYAGGTTLTGGVLQVQNDLALGTGTVTFNGGTLRAGGSVTIANAAFINVGTTALVDSNGNQISLTGGLSGLGGLTVADSTMSSGRLILGGTNTYSGGTMISGGLLQVDGAITQSNVTVASGGTLGGKGTISQSVTVQNGGHLAPGDSPGTLTVGSLNLNAGSTSIFQLGMAGVVGGVANDLVNVTNNLTLGGTLSVNAPSVGYYRLFNYGGSLSGAFDSVTGSTQGTPTVLTNVDHQVNLSVLNGGQQMQFWDGADMAGNGTVDGGAGTWNASNTNWTGAPGNANINDQWRSSVGVFAGAAGGTVSVVGVQSFDTLQFSTTGYVLNAGAGGQLLLAGANTGTINTDSGITATINAPIADGSVTSLTKVGVGTLILGGTNTYSGGTMISGGLLQVDGAITQSNVTVASGGTLGGKGTISQSVTVQNGGHLAPGDSPGTLTVGSLNLNAGSTSIFQLGMAGVVGGVANDLVNVTNNLTLGGMLSVNAPSVGYYRLFNYGGSLSGAFDSVTGSTQGTPTVLTNVDHQVNLSVLNGGQQMQFWDGADMAGNGTVDGGTGTWNTSNTNWTGAPGNANINDQWRSSVGVFAGAAGGTVSVVGVQSFDTLQFSTTGYVLNAGAGGQLLLAGASTGTINTDSGITATINAPIADGSVTSLTKVGVGTLILGGANTYSGGTTIASGTLQLNDGGSIGGNVANSGVFAINHSDAFTFAGLISGAGSLQQNGSGTTTLSGAHTYTGATSVNSGILDIEGSIASSSMTTVNSGAILTGLGTVGNTTVAGGGMFAPGNGLPNSSMTVNGNLALQSGALYLVQINPATASFANVSGTASLAGASVQAFFSSGAYVAKQYTILEAGLVSDKFNTLANTNLPAGFTSTLSYDGTHAYLDLALSFAPSFGGNVNQRNVANTLVNFFNSNGGIPMVFGALTPAGLTQASGETATGTQQTTFDAMNLFMGVMTDPFIGGRGDGVASPSGATGYTDADAQAYAARRKPNDALAAIYTKAPPPVAPFEARWSTWVAGYGGSRSTDGSAPLGSNNTTSSIYGTAVGADYRFSPETVAGFALAGGGTNFSVANGGSGRSDLFQAGAFIRHTAGPAYISGALAYGWQDITTDRTVTVTGVDRLRAGFNANAWSGRLEGGYRFVVPASGGGLGITPYAAGQFTTFDLPAYAESVRSGAGTFALAYGAKSVTNARSEFGFRSDKSFAMSDGIFTLRSRVAWAHDYDSNRSIGATFQALPGASFVVNGARQAADSALVTASAEKKWLNGWSAAATFEGEFSNVTSSYAGRGVVRYGW